MAGTLGPLATLAVALTTMTGTAAADPRLEGRFGVPFEEPTLAGRETDEDCVADDRGKPVCKPAGATVTILGDGRVLYWGALEGIERNQYSMGELGANGANDSSRLLDVDGPTWETPSPDDGGLHEEPMPLTPLYEQGSGDGALFCSLQTLLADGRVLVPGGTKYYADPGVQGAGHGMTEVEGTRGSRIFDPATARWELSGEMHRERWYPTVVAMPDGDVFVASGTRKVMKPVYTDHPEESGRNVTMTETWDLRTGRWRDNGVRARRSLPLFPRLHLLPDGRVFYNAAGQPFNPMGQAYDELSWMEAAAYDPVRRSWQGLGVPGLDTAAPGFRGATFSLMLPLLPDADGRYRRAEFLTGGGTLLPSPGTHLPTAATTITSVGPAGLETRQVGDMTRPRWYSSAVLLPTGEVAAFSGSDRDEVQTPGLGKAIQQAELFDPQSGTWRPLATAPRPRTYHNTAALLPDGRVLIGGHAPLSTMYLNTTDVPGAAPNRKDPSFEVFEPPYLFRGARPRVRRAPAKTRPGRSFRVTVRGAARHIRRVVLIRNTSVTHLVDANQRSVVLPVVRRRGSVLTVRMPRQAAVVPPGPYTLFVNRESPDGPVPSRGRALLVQVKR